MVGISLGAVGLPVGGVAVSAFAENVVAFDTTVLLLLLLLLVAMQILLL